MWKTWERRGRTVWDVRGKDRREWGRIEKERSKNMKSFIKKERHKVDKTGYFWKRGRSGRTEVVSSAPLVERAPRKQRWKEESRAPSRPKTKKTHPILFEHQPFTQTRSLGILVPWPPPPACKDKDSYSYAGHGVHYFIIILYFFPYPFSFSSSSSLTDTVSECSLGRTVTT